MNATDEMRRDHRRRLQNQRAFPLRFVDCSCERGCLVCAYTGLVSRGQAKQLRSSASRHAAQVDDESDGAQTEVQ